MGPSFEDVVEVIDFTYMGTEGGEEVLVEVLRDLKNLATWAEKLGKRAIKMRKAVAVEEAKKRKEKKKEKRAKEVKAQGGKGGGGGAKGPEKGEEETVAVATPEGGPMVFDDPMDIDPVEPDIVEPLVEAMRRLVVDVWSVHLPSDIVGVLVRDSPYQREGAGGEMVPGEGRRGKAEEAEGEEGEEGVSLKVLR
ncbi:hypothetical protein TWF569_003625 [Orbilia oligospora]|uniref:Uncharacterized protein n=1 Tax=Orbilia oligospora TaxID=2813651 RepID=A0A7C8NMU5_ORBOL|nr:hypothetical protein TWF103_001987 [Orbilia oligospora]KAF3119651.1 hypothetical protein TWF569_003625 [Orbilia oligospora]KAF3126704.1 hypothetical protein TWF703_010387 [Orbilia oligospora]